MRGVQDAHQNDKLIPRLFSQLPPELDWLRSLHDNILGNIHLVRCICELTWHHENMDDSYFTKAVRLGGGLNEYLLHLLTFNMINHEAQFGLKMTMAAFDRMTRKLSPLGNKSYFRWMNGGFLINNAYESYHDGRYSTVPFSVLKAIANNPSFLINRGVIAVFIKSILKILSGQKKHQGSTEFIHHDSKT